MNETDSVFYNTPFIAYINILQWTYKLVNNTDRHSIFAINRFSKGGIHYAKRTLATGKRTNGKSF